MKRLFTSLIAVSALLASFIPQVAFAAAGIFPSGGTSVQNGQTFTITVRASGATFDSLQGTISVSGPVSIVSFSAGGATWLPGKSPANNNQFVGIVSPTSSLTVATIKLKGTKEGKGSVSLSGVRLARSGGEVGTSGGSTSFTITRAPVTPGAVTVSSTTHPDQNAAYEARDAEFTWDKASGVTGFSYLIDQTAETVPPTTVTSAEVTTKYTGLALGTHYFHIRALNADGWGPVTHYKITVKAAVDETLAKPVISSISTTSDYINDIEAGTISGIVINGTGPAGYTMNLTFPPELNLPKTTTPEVPEGTPAAAPIEKYPSPVADEAGNWVFTITDPVKVGFYKLIVQGQKDSIVTAESDPAYFEASVANGGQVKLITASDKDKPVVQPDTVKVLGVTVKKQTLLWTALALGNVLLLAGVVFGTYFYLRRRIA